MPTFTRLRRTAALATTATTGAALAAVLLAGPALASPTGPAAATSPTGAYTFRTLNDQHDPTFNQLLGINRSGVIAGYFGSGAAGHLNQGYTMVQRHGQPVFRSETFPGSVQTQVTALNDRGTTVGFWWSMSTANQVNDNFGFYARDGHFHEVNFPTASAATPPVDQLLGVNDHDLAVGFYTDAAGNNHGYTYDIGHRRFASVTVPGATSVTAAAINDDAAIAGFETNAAGATVAFLQHAGSTTTLAYPGATMTQAFGVNDHDEVVGAYQLGSGSTATTHGFTWTPPNGIGTTTVNGVNDQGDLVGFYTDNAGNVDGMLATPTRITTTVRLRPQPVGTATVFEIRGGRVAARLELTGLAPGIAHEVDIQSGSCDVLAAPVVQLPRVTADSAGRVSAEVVSGATMPKLRTASLMVHLGDDPADPTANLPIACINLGAWNGKTITRPFTPLSGQHQYVWGTASFRYNGSTQTLAVRVKVSGLQPYSQHAAHLHTGSCAAQGAVVLMLPDLVANRQGVASATDTLTKVAMPPHTGSEYLNLHLGATSQIVTSAGQPTMLFQPLACGAVH
mgnify:FL=1